MEVHSLSKESKEGVARKLRKDMSRGISKCQRNLKMTIFGRQSAARSMAACYIESTAHYCLEEKDVKEIQKTYNKYVIGSTKIGSGNSKYMEIKNCGGGCVDINKYSKAIRIALLNEAINSPNPRGPNMMIQALETLGIKRSNIPMMMIWELRILAKLICRMKLKFWEAVLNDYVEMQEENNKYKFNKKNAETGITEIKSDYSRKKLRKKF